MDFSPIGRVCSFCGVVGTQDTKFSGGLGAMMCADCLSYYYEISQSPARIAAVSRPPWEGMSDVEMLSMLPLISATADQVAAFLEDWVQLARARKISWREIGKALGVSRQAAWERFAQREVPSRDSSVSPG
ncbi:hypothetical protein FB382_003754 [Nocardioides ginsengisegetis]|uniref:ClpX C4-type zinc finger n=1 Tax=Nocardioides ginsengisegetis TaxID=661491 RepID=A0A7W3J388_9ACTN|nr:AsnC family protein [Nocardioides ginsengisegetis]MBA8805463.1 hypothetical protein [Nocardioides ginsengisegetis]